MRSASLMSFLTVAVLGPAARPASADDAAAGLVSTAARISLSASIGYTYPIGSAERGTNIRDVSFGLVPLSLAAAYDLDRAWSANARLRYAPNIPTLCASGPDCVSSIGHDIVTIVGVGRWLPGWRRFTPQVTLDIGWEWFTTKLSDSGVTSTRSWNGPVATAEIFVDIRSRGLWTFGPAVAIDAGIFSHVDLQTSAWHTSGSTATAIHFWPTIAFRVGRRL